MRRPFRFSANVPTPLQPVASWRDALGRIEDAGFSSVAIADHWTGGYGIEPMVALTAAAMCTTGLRLQTAVLGNDYRHPVLVHRMAATLDVISEGRLELGLGAGWMLSDYTSAGLAYDPAGKRIARLEEAIQVLKGLFSGQPCSFQGAAYQVQMPAGLPLPVQRPHPPLLIGGGGRRILRLAGREADIVGINANLKSGRIGGPDAIRDVSFQRLAEKIGWVQEGANAAGRDPEGIELAMAQWLLYVTPSASEAARCLEAAAERTGVEVAWLERAPGVLVGSVDRCVEKLIELRERRGISYIQLDAGPRATKCFEAVAAIVGKLAGT